MLKKSAVALLIFTLLLSGCAVANRSKNISTSEYPLLQVVQPTMAPAAMESAGSRGAYALDQTTASVDRLVIKNASLSMAVNDPLKSMDTISHMAENMGGFVVNADMYQQTLSNGIKVPQVSMSIRVPAEKLDEALSTIKAETTLPIISENESSQDVTAEYTDLNSRLTNLQAAEKQLQEIMASATKTEDVLSVYSQLVSVREQIELIKGQMKYYEQSAALSSVSIQLMANAAVQPITIAGWQPSGVAKEAIQSLVNALQKLGSFGIRLVIFYLPILIVTLGPIALIVWGITRWTNKNRKAKAAPIVPPQA